MGKNGMTIQKTAVIFGAGKMACGLLGPLLHQSGIRPVFISRGKHCEAINRQGFFVQVGGGDGRHVHDCEAFAVSDIGRVKRAIADSTIVFTAVGIDNIPAIAPIIADGLQLRMERPGKPLNIVASENLPGTGAYLRHQIIAAASQRMALMIEKYAGFSAALTHRIMTGGTIINGMMHFHVDAPGDLIIDQRGLAGALPEITGATVCDNFDALFLEKLSTINLAQAAASYMGHLQGHAAVHEAANSCGVSMIMHEAVAEAAAAFEAEYPELGKTVANDAKDAVVRVADPKLGDTIKRICRGPMRKLAAQERLLGPARLAVRHGMPHGNLVKVIAAALAYYDDADPQSKLLQFMIADEGLDYVLTAVCGLLPHDPLSQEIKIAFAALVRDKTPESWQATRAHAVGKIVQDTVLDAAADLAGRDISHLIHQLTEDFQSARITAFLPVLIKNRMRDRLGVHLAA